MFTLWKASRKWDWLKERQIPASTPTYICRMLMEKGSRGNASHDWLIYRFVYLFDGARGGTADRGRGRSRLPTEQGARFGAQSQDPRITTWADGRRLTKWATQATRLSWLKGLFLPFCPYPLHLHPFSLPKNNLSQKIYWAYDATLLSSYSLIRIISIITNFMRL